jgi:hypothetical protein
MKKPTIRVLNGSGIFPWKLAAPRVLASSSKRRVQPIDRIARSIRNLFSRRSISTVKGAGPAYYRLASNG